MGEPARSQLGSPTLLTNATLPHQLAPLHTRGGGRCLPRRTPSAGEQSRRWLGKTRPFACRRSSAYSKPRSLFSQTRSAKGGRACLVLVCLCARLGVAAHTVTRSTRGKRRLPTITVGEDYMHVVSFVIGQPTDVKRKSGVEQHGRTIHELLFHHGTAALILTHRCLASDKPSRTRYVQPRTRKLVPCSSCRRRSTACVRGPS